MSLIDFDSDPMLYVTKQKAASSDALGMSVNDPVGGTPFAGRVSRISGQQILAWATLGMQADCELFCLRDDLESGDVVTDDEGVSYLITGRMRRVAKGNIHEYYRYTMKTQSLS